MGFGYEHKGDDYKVMRILNYVRGAGTATIVEVYSTNSESWREVETDVRFSITTCCCDVIVEGFTYWMARNTNEPRIVLASFDLSKEMFSVIPVPEVLITESQSFKAMNYQGSLALLAYSFNSGFKKGVEVWMIEDGSSGEGVWHKKFIIDIDFDFSMHWGLTSGDIVVKYATNMLFSLLNLRTKRWRKIGKKSSRSVFYYTESLVSIKGSQFCRRSIKGERKVSILRRKSKLELTGT